MRVTKGQVNGSTLDCFGIVRNPLAAYAGLKLMRHVRASLITATNNQKPKKPNCFSQQRKHLRYQVTSKLEIDVLPPIDARQWLTNFVPIFLRSHH